MLPFDPRALAVVERLRRAGFDAALVGGCVRDGLLGLPPHDYDAATAARPEQIQALFADCPQYGAGSRFGTVAVEWDGLWVEVTTFLREEGYADHRRPDRVVFSLQLEDDLARRDWWTGSGGGPIWSGGWCGAWGTRTGASVRTRCGFCGPSALPRSWIL